MKTKLAWTLLALLPGCIIEIPVATPVPDEPALPRANITPPLQPLAWLVGNWRKPDGTTDHWVAANGALYGVHLLADDQFEVTIIDDTKQAAGPVELSVDSHDNAVTRHALAATISEPMLKGARRFDGKPAPELDAANHAASVAASAQGIEGWVDAFDTNGKMWSEDGGWVKGRADIVRDMTSTFATTNVTWSTNKSALADSGSIGATWSHFDASLRTTGEVVAQGNFLTVWRKQVDGSWKVVFETGRTDHANE